MKNLNNVQQSLINIFKVSIKNGPLEELAETCHKELIRLIGIDKSKNFYLSVHVRDSFYFLPYYKDEKETNLPVNKSIDLKGGLTDYLSKIGKTTLIDQEWLKTISKEGKIEKVIGSPPFQWIGAPLISNGQFHGLLVVHTYDSSVHYSEDDIELMDYVSKNIALAIERKNKDEEIIENKILLEKKIHENSIEIIRKNVKLKDKIAKIKRNEKIQKVLFSISEAKSKAANLADLLEKIHAQVRTLMQADNFYVAILVDREKGLYRFPYIVDENPEEWEDPNAIVDLSRGMTHFVLKTEHPMLADRKTVLEYIKKYNVGMLGKTSQSWMGIPLKTDRGEIVGVVAIQSYSDPKAYNKMDKKILTIISTSIADAVKYKQLEEEKRTLEEKILELKKMEAMGILASGIAHEFNNLLSIIMGHSYTGMLDNQKGEKNYRRYEKIEKAGEKAAELVEKLMIFAQKRYTEKSYIHDLEKAIHNGVILAQRSISYPCDIVVNIKEKLWPVLIDRHEIDDILSNILENALHAILKSERKDGRISISAENYNGQPPHTFYLRQSDKYIYIKIEDNGHGMEKSTLSQIFNPFFTTKEPGKGTGLGLAIVYSIIKDNHGSIDVESEPGQGSIFHIYLPLMEG